MKTTEQTIKFDYEFDADDDYILGDCNESQPCRGDECDVAELDLLALEDDELKEYVQECARIKAEFRDLLPF